MHIEHETRGISVIEVLIAIGMTAMVIVGIGASYNAIHRLNLRSEHREAALTYAKESMELISAMAAANFSCTCTTDSCADTDSDGSVDRCTRTSGDSMNCTLLPGYTSCWTEYADGLNTNSPLHLANVGGTATLIAGAEAVPTDSDYQRTIAIENVGGDEQRKKISVEVSWMEQGLTKTTRLETILTGWASI